MPCLTAFGTAVATLESAHWAAVEVIEIRNHYQVRGQGRKDFLKHYSLPAVRAKHYNERMLQSWTAKCMSLGACQAAHKFLGAVNQFQGLRRLSLDLEALVLMLRLELEFRPPLPKEIIRNTPTPIVASGREGTTATGKPPFAFSIL